MLSKDAPLLNVLLSLLSISVWSVAGVASRIAILSSVDSHYFFPDSSLITVNVLGSLIIGFAYGLSGFSDILPYTYLGISVGFCGSLTTFSSWVHAILQTDSSATVEVVTGLSMPFIAFLLGEDLAHAVSLLGDEKLMSKKTAMILDKYLVFSATVGCVLSMVLVPVLGVSGISNQDIIASALGPLGALSRYALSKGLNGRWGIETFMIGTLAANILAVIILGSLLKCSDNNDWCNESTIGIAGSLSTVSSWVLDTIKIYRKDKIWAYFYCLISLVAGVVVLIPFVNVG